MKKFQLITYNPELFNNFEQDFDISNFNNLKSLDNYDINIFDLSSEGIWQNKNSYDSCPSTNTLLSSDFYSIKKMIKNSNKTKIIIILPQNIYFQGRIQLKDMIPTFKKIIDQLIVFDFISLEYENNDTLINNKECSSAFYFINNIGQNITKSRNSEKITTISIDNVVITTLNLLENNDTSVLFDFFEEAHLIDEGKKYPDWLEAYNFADDEIQYNKIEQAKSQIEVQKSIIANANEVLMKNLRYKSILFTNSADLVKVVFEILEYIFDISLADFKDDGKEDFLFKKDDITFIGEIKGVTSNVKNEHISQLDVHCSKYMDKLQEENITENIKKILIINYERTRDINIRNEINEMQINLAEKQNTLIIDTQKLLMIFEKLLNNELSKNKVIDYIKKHSGVVVLDEIN